MTTRTLVTEHAQAPEAVVARPLSQRLLLISAATKAGLDARLEQLSEYLEGADARLADVAYTLVAGRKAMEHRASIVLPQHGAIREALAGKASKGRAKPGAASVAFMFPGQGAQFIGMGRALYAASERYRNTFDRCEARLTPRVGVNLRELLLAGGGQADAAPAESLKQTAVAQPALFVVEYAMADLLLHFGLRPSVLLGHSIGEYAAACLAGVFELEAALELVAERGRLMQSMPPGAMLAVKAEPGDLSDVLGEQVNLAAHNAPGLSVISGPFDAVEAFRTAAEAKGLQVRALHTSHAFHSMMMDPILDDFRAAVERAKPKPPVIDIVSTMTGKLLTDAEAVSSEYWAKQLRNPVQFAEAARRACSDPGRVFVEVGPGVSLLTSVAKLVTKLTDDEHRPRKLVETLGHPKADLDASEATLNALGQLWMNGAEIEWKAFFEGDERRLVRLPTYPYQRRRHVIEPPKLSDAGSPSTSVAAAAPVESEAAAGPENVVEARLQALLEARLGRELEGEELELKFLELGFDSLAMTQLAAKLRQEFGVDVRVRQLFEQFKTPSQLAQHLLDVGVCAAPAPPPSGPPRPSVLPPTSTERGPAQERFDERLTRIEHVLEQLAKDVSRLGKPTSVADADAPPVAAGAPLTASQREIWVAARIGGDEANVAYNECRAFLFDGELDASMLLASLDALRTRHEALRQTFSADGSTCVTKDDARLAIEKSDLRGTPPEELERQLETLTQSQVERPFDLVEGPLFRGVLIQLNDRQHRLVLCAHHVIVDGSSWEVLIRELAELYSARKQQRAPQLSRAVPYSEYRTAERDYRASSQASEDEAFWVQHLDGQTEDLNLPTDRPRGIERTFGSSRLDHHLQPELVERVRKVAAKHACTPQTFLLAAFQILLHRLSNQSDIVCGVPTSGQAAAGMESLVGHCVHVLPLRFRIDTSCSMGNHLRSVHGVMLDGLEHQRATFTEVLPRLNRARDPARPPLIQVSFGMGRSQKRPEFSGLTTRLRVVPRISETFELYVYATEDQGSLEVSWSYNEHLFDSSTIELWQRCFVTLVTEMVDGKADRTIGALDLVSSKDRSELLERAHGPRRTRELHVPVHQMLCAHPADRIAIVDAEGSYTYEHVNERANRVGHLLRARGVGPGSLVAVCLDRSVALVEALIGVWRAGAAYIPLDPAYPTARIQTILEDSRSPLVLTSRSLTDRIPDGFRVTLIEDVQEELERLPNVPPDLEPQASDTAYVIFTSGSTGRPKGVEIPQGAFTNFIQAMQETPGFSRNDVILALTTVSFDISGLELFLPLATGGKAIIASREQAADPKELRRLINEHGVTVAQATPATWQMMIDSGWAGSPTLRILCGGEAFPQHLAKKLLKSCKEIWNVYGPTETTVWSTVKRILDPSDITIGRPIDNTTLYVLDERQALVPRGVHGELWIGGAGVAKGYFGREELTTERFIPSPFEAGDRIYRTGDLARLRRDAEFECLGRVDFQVKIRGFRIELGEVEAAILDAPDVKACVVVAREDAPGEKTLAGYVVPENGRSVDVDELRDRVAQKLPAYMVPSAFCVLDALPMTPSQKVDRKALPPPTSVSRTGAKAAEPPRDELETRVRNLWARVIGHPELGVTDNFHAAGGHSLMAVRLVDLINQEFNVDLPVKELFNHPTVRELTSVLKRETANAAEQGAPSSRRAPTSRRLLGRHRGLFCIREGEAGAVPLFLIHGDRADGLLPPHLDERQEIWGYHHQGADGERIEFKTVESLTRHCHGEWLAQHGERPCVLAGHSFGALVAYQVACLRQEESLETPRLILIDARHPAALSAREMVWSPVQLKRWLNGLRLQVEAKRDCALAESHLDRGQLVPLALRNKYILGTYRLASQRYEPPEFSGQLDIIRSEEFTLRSPADYWERSAVGGIRRFVVEGTHLSIVRDGDSIARVAEHIRRILREIAKPHQA